MGNSQCRTEPQTVSVRLEPVYLANVLLHIDNVETIKAFPFVSKNCHEATLILKTNPAAFCKSPSAILRLFPNINTMVVRRLSCFKRSDTLPDTVTSIGVQKLDADALPEACLRFADRVVEIRDKRRSTSQVDFSLFPRLRRLALNDVPTKVTLPPHRLKRITVSAGPYSPDPLTTFPPECADQIAVIYRSRKAFDEAKTLQLPPNVRVFYHVIEQGVAPEDFFPLSRDYTLPAGLGLDELRAFDEVAPIAALDLFFDEPCPRCDLSFLNSITALTTTFLRGCRLTIPTILVSLSLDAFTENVRVSGTDNLTRLSVVDKNAVIAPCPRLRVLEWHGTRFSEKMLPCPARNVQALPELVIKAGTMDPGFPFPPGLTSLVLELRDEAYDVAFLTGLQRLDISIRNQTPLDLSGLTGLTWLNTNQSSVARLPRSLVRCTASVRSDADLSPLTRLTALSLRLGWPKQVTFPTGLKKLCIIYGALSYTNIGDVALETFKMDESWSIQMEDLEMLPKTVKKVVGKFYPPSLKERLREMFPLTDQ